MQDTGHLKNVDDASYTKSMNTSHDTPLAPFTSLKVGGPAETLLETETYDQTLEAFNALEPGKSYTVLGYGSNSLISDKGLPGTTIVWRGGAITFEGQLAIADAGVWWDDLVQAAIEKSLWGLELMSEIPSSVGGAITGNIAAYGQQVSDTLEWLELYDTDTKTVTRHDKDEFVFEYRHCSLQEHPNLIVMRAAFRLGVHALHELKYAAAVSVAQELECSTRTLEGRRKAIIETRARAGSIYHPDDPSMLRTAGSFFKNPMVSTEQALELAKFDESGATAERILQQNKIHGGSSHRASAAHVLLAAGFNRGDTWGHVRLHPSHVLKLEALEGATATEINATVQMIVRTVKDKLGIDIVPEARFLGDFS